MSVLRILALGCCSLLLGGAAPTEGSRPKRLAAGRRHYLLRWNGPAGPAWRERLPAAGARITARLSPSEVVATGPDDLPERAEGFTAAILPGREKLSPVLAQDEFTAWLVEFHADVPAADTREIARRTGAAILEHPDLLPHQLLVTGESGIAAALAEWDEVAYVLPASLDLVLGNRVVGCAGAVIEDGIAAPYARTGNGWGASGPDGAEVHYFFQNITGKIARSTAESEIVRAFQEWAKYGAINFSAAPSASASRSITVQFGRRAHGDDYPFDGPGRVLAHTFYPAPPNREPLAGDMHLDEDEDWHTGGSPVDLFTVALHEAGHALGLAHSDKPGAVMYPYYRQASGLADDDIAGIRTLYGNREAPVRPAAPAFALNVVEPPAATTAATIGLRGTVENATGAAQVTWSSNRGGTGQAAGSTSWSIPELPLSPGANTITLRAADQGGHSASRTLVIERQSSPAPATPAAPPAAAPPALRITSPAFTIVSTSLASIAIRGSASTSVERVAWSTSNGQSGTATGTAAWSADVPLLEGTNTVTVRAYDAAGNSSWRAVTVVRR